MRIKYIWLCRDYKTEQKVNETKISIIWLWQWWYSYGTLTRTSTTDRHTDYLHTLPQAWQDHRCREQNIQNFSPCFSISYTKTLSIMIAHFSYYQNLYTLQLLSLWWQTYYTIKMCILLCTIWSKIWLHHRITIKGILVMMNT